MRHAAKAKTISSKKQNNKNSTKKQMNEIQKTLSPTLSKRTIKDTLEGDQFKLAISKVLPKHLTADRFVRVAIMAMTRTPKLSQCEPASFFQCLMNLSQMGLEPDGRRAHLIPYENRKRGVMECQLIVDYKGLAELVMRSGMVSNLHADVVCDNDQFEYNKGELVVHKIDFRKPRGDVYAAYALCRFKDGSEKCEVMTRDEVESIRRRSRAADSGPWVTDWSEMAKKTCFRRLSKWLSLSPEFRDALDKDSDSMEDIRFDNAKQVAPSPSFEIEFPIAPTPKLEAPSESPSETPADVEPKRSPGRPKKEMLPIQILRSYLVADEITEAALLDWGHQTGSIPDEVGIIDEISTETAILLTKETAWPSIKAQLKLSTMGK